MNAMDGVAERPLNRLLRMAVLAGVESAVRMHVRRGDDLDARDADGMTPLMLAALKNRHTICALLLSSGADASLTDPIGRDARKIAEASGAAEAAAILSLAERETGVLEEAPASVFGELVSNPDAVRTVTVDDEAAPHLMLPDVSHEDDLSQDSFGWEPDEDGPPPDGDETLAAAASAAHMAISSHVPIDTAEDWEDFDALLPERSVPLPRAGDEEGRERIRRLIARALRQGSVPEAEVEAVCAEGDGSRNPEGEALLGIVLGDLGLETDDRIETTSLGAGDEGEAGAGEDEVISEALEFLDDLGSGRNEPIRIYVKEMSRRKLLTAEEEPALAREIEEGGYCALDALASWTEGVAAILEAAGHVRTGEADARAISNRGVTEPLEEGSAEQSEPDDHEDGGDERSETAADLTDDAADFLEWAGEVERLAKYAGKGSAGEKALRDALASAKLSREFLLGLANGGKAKTGAAERFAASMERQAAARERLAVCNLRVALSIAKRYMGRGLPLDDLVQEANIGLLKAVDRFDWRRGFRFSTYATWWIRQQVTRALADKGKTIRMPVHVHEKIARMIREADDIERATGCKPSAQALAKILSVNPARVAALMARMEEPSSLFEPDANGAVPADSLADTAADGPAEAAEKANLSAVIGKLLAQLDPKSAEILALRFGLGGEDTHTLEELGELHGVTRERIRQIEAKALRQLRHPSRADVLRDFIDLAAPLRSHDESANSGSRDGGDEQAKCAAVDVERCGRGFGKEQPDDAGATDTFVRPESKAVERVLSMARKQGFRVEDARDTGGDIAVTVGSRSDGVARSLARGLMNAGFKVWPGRVFRK